MNTTLSHQFGLLLGLGMALLATPASATALPSYSCVFTEPFISVDVYPGGIRYATPEGASVIADVNFTMPSGVTKLGGMLPSGKAFVLDITKGSASDGMSDMMRPFTGKLSGPAVSRVVQGACLKFPDGTTPRPVKGVSSNDVLNVRTKPTVRSAIVNRLNSRGFVWAFPDNMVGNWARVATAKMPAGESGNVTVVTGWVNARFLGLPSSR